MKNTAAKVCIGILTLVFIAVTVGVIITALGNTELAGTVAQIAAAVCLIGWVLAMRNFRMAEEGDFSSEEKSFSILEKLFRRSENREVASAENDDEASESEIL